MFSAPRSCAIRAVVPLAIPLPIASIMKKIGNDSASPACAFVPSIPAYRVSTTLYMVLKKKPIDAGIAIRRIRKGIESLVIEKDSCVTGS